MDKVAEQKARLRKARKDPYYGNLNRAIDVTLAGLAERFGEEYIQTNPVAVATIISSCLVAMEIDSSAAFLSDFLTP
jgi:hypothetical protein